MERIKKRSQKKKKWYASDDDLSSSSDESESESGYNDKKKRKKNKKRPKKKSEDSSEDEERNDGDKSHILNDNDIVRREMGLDWMLRPKDDNEKKSERISDHQPEEAPIQEVFICCITFYLFCADSLLIISFMF